MTEEPMTDDPRFSGLPASVVDTAKEAHCSRCRVQIIESASVTGTLFLNYMIPTLNVRHRDFLCGSCALDFREFLYPELLADENFQAVKEMLQGRWT